MLDHLNDENRAQGFVESTLKIDSKSFRFFVYADDCSLNLPSSVRSKCGELILFGPLDLRKAKNVFPDVLFNTIWYLDIGCPSCKSYRF